MSTQTKKIMIAKPGLDSHDRGAKLVVRSLRDAGFECEYLAGPHTPDELVTLVIRKNIGVLGLSCLSGAHRHWLPEITALLKKRGAAAVKVFVGGVIPKEDFEYLYQCGVKAIFPSGSSMNAVIEWVQREMK